MTVDIRLRASQYSAVPNGADGFPVEARGTRDGSQSTADWLQLKALEGRVFQVDVGALSTPILGGGAGTIIDQDQPEAVISVPTGTTIMPVRIAVQCQTPLLATDADESEILIAVDRAAACPFAGTWTAETALNMRTDNPRTSNCTCKSACTVNETNPTLGIELAHKVITGDMNGTPANALWGTLDLVYEPKVKPIIVGPAAVYVYWGGTVATNAFAQIQWAEVPSTDITG
jgi:hypothetical protein